MKPSFLVAIALFVVLSIEISCGTKHSENAAPELRTPPEFPDASALETNPADTEASIENVEPSPSLSLRQQLMGPNTNSSTAIFSDNNGVLAINELGAVNRFSSEPFEWLTIDYELDLLWLDRLTHASEPGLFVLDMAQNAPSAVKLTRLTKEFEITTLSGEVLPMTDGMGPYRISVHPTGLQISVYRGDHKCGDECTPSEEAKRVVSEAASRSVSDSPPHFKIDRFPDPTPEQLKIGAMLDVPGFSVKLRYFRYPGHTTYGWELYDPDTKEYISAFTFDRSKESSNDAVTHLMICDGGRTLVVGEAFFDSQLRRLDSGSNVTNGVCLSGGLLFENRTTRMFDPRVRAQYGM